MRRDNEKTILSRRNFLRIGAGLSAAAAFGLTACGPDQTNAEQPPASPAATTGQTPGSTEATPDVKNTPTEAKVYDFDPASSDFYQGLSNKDQKTLDEILETGNLEDFYKEDYTDRVHATDLLAGFVGESLDKFHSSSDYGIDAITASLDEVRDDPSIAMTKAQAKLDIGFQLMRTYNFDAKNLAEQGVDLEDFSNPKVQQLLNRQVFARYILVGGQQFPTQDQGGGRSETDASRDWQLTKALEEKITAMADGEDLETTASDLITVSQSGAKYNIREDTAGVNFAATEMSVDLKVPIADDLGNKLYTISTLDPVKFDGKKLQTWNLFRAYKDSI